MARTSSTRRKVLLTTSFSLIALLLLIGIGGAMGSQDSNSLSAASDTASSSFTKDAGYGSRYSSPSDSAGDASVSSDSTGGASVSSGGTNAAKPVEGGQASDGGDTTVVATPSDRLLVVTGSAAVQVKDPVAAADGFINWANQQGGYLYAMGSGSPTPMPEPMPYEDVAGATTSQSTSYSPVQVTVKIPSLPRGFSYLAGLPGAKVTSRTMNAEDVTAQSADLNGQARALSISIERLQTFMARSTDSQSLIRLENELTRRQAELDSLRSQQRALANQVALNTLTVTFSRTPKEGAAAAVEVKSSDHRGFGSGLSRGWEQTTAFAKSFFYGLAFILPLLLVVVPLGAVVLILLWLLSRFAPRLTNGQATTTETGEEQ